MVINYVSHYSSYTHLYVLYKIFAYIIMLSVQ